MAHERSNIALHNVPLCQLLAASTLRLFQKMTTTIFKISTLTRHFLHKLRDRIKNTHLCVCGSSTSMSPTGDSYRRTSGDSSFILSRMVLSCNGNSCAWNTTSLTVLCSWNVAPFGLRLNESKTTTYGDLPASVAL